MLVLVFAKLDTMMDGMAKQLNHRKHVMHFVFLNLNVHTSPTGMDVLAQDIWGRHVMYCLDLVTRIFMWFIKSNPETKV